MDDRLNDPFGRTSLPVEHLDRQARVALLLEAADALVGGESIPRDAAQLLGEALHAFLRHGGELDRLLGIRGVPGSHVTVPTLARRIVMGGAEAPRATSAEVRTFEGV